MPTQPDDDELRLIRESGVVLRMGLLSLAAGTGSYRVKESMRRVARAMGISRHHAHVTLTEITSTSHRGSSFRTEVAETRAVGVDAARLGALEQLAMGLEGAGRRVTAAEVAGALDRIERTGPLYPAWANALAAAAACGAFAFLVGGGAVEIAGAFVGAGLGQLLRRALIHRGYNHLGVVMLAAGVASLSYRGFVAVLDLVATAGSAHESGYVAAVLFLVPGFPLITAGLDLARLDLSAGVARTTYALLVISAAGLAVWAVSVTVGLSPGPLPPPDVSYPVLVGLRLLAGFAGVAGFAVVFNGTPRMVLTAAGIGAVANTLRLVLVDAGLAAQAAAALGALLVGLLAAVLAPRLRVPRITVSVPAVVIMVPGVLAFRAVYALAQGDTAGALTNGTQAALTIVALPIGLAVARMLTDRAWAFDRRHPDRRAVTERRGTR